MNIKQIINSSWYLLFSVVLMGQLSGCMKEDPYGCGAECFLNIRAFDAEGRELTRSEVTSVFLYVFDDNMMFAGSYRTEIGETVKVGIEQQENLHIVAWGNLNGGCDTNIGNDASGSFISLRSATRADYKVSPDDIFHGTIMINGNDVDNEKDLSIFRKVGSMTIRAGSLKEFAGFADEDYSVVIRETYSSIGFDGTFSGEKVSYNPHGEFTTSEGRERYYVSPFNLIPEQAGLHIDFYHGADLIVSIADDGAGKPITVTEGMLTNVAVDFGSTIKVDISLTEWGDENVGKEF